MRTFTPPLIICIILLAGCIKHPEEPQLPPKPQWLINKVVEITNTYGVGSLPGDPPVGRSKSLWEIEYNRYYKPYIRRVYYSARDTLNLQLSTVDTLLYDAQYRVKEQRTLVLIDGSVSTRFLSYQGNDTLPFRIQFGSSGGATEYVYRGDTVFAISIDPKAGRDTSRYIYPGGNLTHYYSGGFQIDVFESYDNGFSIYRAMNLSQGNLFNLPFDWYSTPRLSRNNWTYANTVPANRYIQYNAQGLPVSSSVQEYYPERRRLSRYEYFTPAP